MAKVKLNPAFLELRGAMGDVVFRKRGDTTYISLKPKSNGSREPSDAQLAQRQVFTQARHYTNYAMTDETLRAFYEEIAERQGATVHGVCMSDFLHPPVIQWIERQDGRVLVHATDNIMVARVKVTVLDAEGNALEAGEAVKGQGDLWEYVPQVQGSQIRAEAWDLPGHKATATSLIE